MTKCPVMYAFNTSGKLIPVRCGLWSCPDCAKDNARLWSWRVRLHVDKAGKTAYFWTLTLRGKYHTAESGFSALPKLWDTFRKAVQRAYKPDKWSYCAFVEGQPKRDYMPHFHIISMRKSPKRLKDLAMECGFGYQATESKVNSGKAANYCAKYASKQSPKTPKGFRRVRASQDWTKLPDKKMDGLIVRARDEKISDYIVRVADITGCTPDMLYDQWDNAHPLRED